jgi:uncharacterized membrane protein
MDAEPSRTATVLFARWLLMALFLAGCWFAVYGLFEGFGDRLWLKALFFGAVVAGLMRGEEEWRARRQRRAPETAD